MTENAGVAQILEALDSVEIPDAATRWAGEGGRGRGAGRTSAHNIVEQAIRGDHSRAPVATFDETVSFLAQSAGQQYDVDTADIIGAFDSIINGTAGGAEAAAGQSVPPLGFEPRLERF